MKFSAYPYPSMDIESFQRDFRAHVLNFQQSQTADEQIRHFNEITQMRNHFRTVEAIMYIRHTIDTNDDYYNQENELFDRIYPLFSEVENEFFEALLASTHRETLEKKLGARIFQVAEIAKKTFSPEIIEDLQLENQWASKFVKLTSSAAIPFHGEELNLSQIASYLESPDRSIRKEAFQATAGFFSDNESAYDEIYDQLVKIRDQMAKKLGFKNFIELGYARMGRVDYDADDVANYRRQIAEDIVPLAAQVFDQQQKRLGLNSLKYYDELYRFDTGNARPIGDEKFLLEAATKMYRSLSEETGRFFDSMLEGDLFDLSAKKGKAGGGYCAYIPEYKAPFIFANFNGTSGDVGVLTHEAGHAFQAFQSQHLEAVELREPTYETAEIHSMSMEFFTWPWMEDFFGDNAEKYRYTHLVDAITFLPYGACVDEFQHLVYEHPEATPAERKEMWHQTEQKYMPWRDYDGHPLMEQGGFWFKQGHIFSVPFYYIDYTLAQVCALQFFVQMHDDREKAWRSYLDLCSLGGSESFTHLLKKAGLENPFDDGSIRKLIPTIEEYFDRTDDTSL